MPTSSAVVNNATATIAVKMGMNIYIRLTFTKEGNLSWLFLLKIITPKQ
jgi:hypothetical protein